ncbi:hypothetical protein [Streptomyces sp. 351MFTsu5.1]|uniref:hypothetical protein n=1 Tax=Streptomyces sp. 351MFTsu5.1 TaxID=1172180 RepID=UPI00036F685B|nr:hypothetical protein [Streptomyces sp. 351MFTsu5.1]
MQQQDLTVSQKKAFEDNEADFRRFDDELRGIRETARARLRAHGWDTDSDDTKPCLSCPCPDFLPGGALGNCKRGGCPHSLLDHDMPR